jgi:hypothetical protein
MAETVERQSWWVRPLAVLVAVGIFLAFFTALAANIDTVRGWFGLRNDDTPVSISFQIGKLVRPDDGSILLAISYKKAGSAPLRDCRFLMDTGEVDLPGQVPEFEVAAGPSAKDLHVPFRLAAQRALNSPNISVALFCDKASSVAMPLNVRNLPVAKP